MSEKEHTACKSRKPLSVESFKSHAAEEVLKAALEELGWKNVSYPNYLDFASQFHAVYIIIHVHKCVKLPSTLHRLI